MWLRINDFDLLIGTEKTGAIDATCIFCEEKFSDDKRCDLWVQCVMCSMWAHDECSGADKEVYICDFCK